MAISCCGRGCDNEAAVEDRPRLTESQRQSVVDATRRANAERGSIQQQQHAVDSAYSLYRATLIPSVAHVEAERVVVTAKQLGICLTLDQAWSIWLEYRKANAPERPTIEVNLVSVDDAISKFLVKWSKPA